MVDPTIRCQDCGHEHDLSRSSGLGETAKEQYELANEFATRHGVELPSAYSILLGLMTLAEAHEATAAKKEKQREKNTPEPAPAPLNDGSTALPEIDPMVAAQAAADAAKPDPGPDDAVLVLDADDADNDRTSDALPVSSAQPRKRYSNAARHRRARAKEEKVTIHVEREMAEQRRKLTWSQGILLAVLASLTLGLSGRHAYRTWQRLVEEGKNAQKMTSASAKAVEGAEEKAVARAREEQRGSSVPNAMKPQVVRDANNRVTQVIGTTPMSVLLAYCEAVSTTDTYEREPLELAQATPPTPNQRFGIFRDFSQLESDRAIRITQNRETKRWIAGNGREPIPTREAPAQPDTIRRAALGDRP
ncbi:MAG: hypothetical protein GTN89_03025 [Acidobacteria bacterium]|nr:hypothetical protein [Acidobacteriota bacterium]NIO58299.1 hypothetical protein [Acidobacteriota bacterium]NIQ29355.1 hypothetical protein [Acidobacteriota bacterium]